MEEKYIMFYQGFHKAFDEKSKHCSNTLSDCRVVSSSELKKDIYERNKSRRILFNWV